MKSAPFLHAFHGCCFSLSIASSCVLHSIVTSSYSSRDWSLDLGMKVLSLASIFAKRPLWKSCLYNSWQDTLNCKSCQLWPFPSLMFIYGGFIFVKLLLDPETWFYKSGFKWLDGIIGLCVAWGGVVECDWLLGNCFVRLVVPGLSDRVEKMEGQGKASRGKRWIYCSPLVALCLPHNLSSSVLGETVRLHLPSFFTIPTPSTAIDIEPHTRSLKLVHLAQ